jgi:hypothetical protein
VVATQGRNLRSVVRDLPPKIAERRGRELAVMTRLTPLLGACTQKYADTDHRQLEQKAAHRSPVLRLLLNVRHQATALCAPGICSKRLIATSVARR